MRTIALLRLLGLAGAAAGADADFRRVYSGFLSVYAE